MKTGVFLLKVLLFVGMAAAIATPFLLSRNPQTGWINISKYLIELFLYWASWTALCWLEKARPTIVSIIGANMFFIGLLFCITTAFLIMKWWIVLIFIPFAWFFGGRLGGKLGRVMPSAIIYLVAGITAFAFMLFFAYAR